MRIKLQKLNQWIDLRNEQANLYFKYLINLKKISLIKKLKKTKPSFHLMVIRTNKRNELKKYLKSKGIMTSIHYPLSLPEIPVFKKQHYGYCRKMKSLKFNRQILSLPIGEHLNSKDIKYVCNQIKSFFDD